ncbi:ammonium transporter 3 member 2-like protein [Cinnamomum micranthum f. kanehirae]|uniref:Ammonium transporter 3 member 2-like protein n=1 Tax=Cinnamomum micranthum f. kanehirae TaxID=337451 RepID=A0A3S3QUD4_9MAGN|nr:ammonium transporter 3 member 2-like protein [Cinnamomum micranthum f. kanehirae]
MAGIVAPWAAVVMGTLSGLIPWYTMMVLYKRFALFQKVDDTLGVFHTHAVAGLLGGVLSGLFAKPELVKSFYTGNQYKPGVAYSFYGGQYRDGAHQLGVQLLGALFVTVWNIVITSAICIIISRIVSLRMEDEALKIGDDAVHGEEAYALWGDGERILSYVPRLSRTPRLVFCGN